jgi:pumilio family protein 6
LGTPVASRRKQSTQSDEMAGTKRESAAATASDSKVKSKKVKVDKKASSGDSKPAKKSKKTEKKVSTDIDESDTSEKENGYNGFSAKPDVEMTSPDEDSESQQNGKTHKRKAEDEPSEYKKKSKYETPKEISSKLADMHGKSADSTYVPLTNRV